MFKLIRDRTQETFSKIIVNRTKDLSVYYNSDMCDYRNNSDTVSKLIEYLNFINDYSMPVKSTEYGLFINTDRINDKTLSNLYFLVKTLLHYPNKAIVVNDKNVKSITELTEKAINQLILLGVKIND